MARILYVWDADYPWDVRTEKICLALSRGGHEVHIAARNRRWGPISENLPEGQVHRLPPWTWVGRRIDGLLSFPAFISPRWYLHLQGLVRRHDIELIITRDLPLCPTSLWAARNSGIPVLLDMAENYPALLKDVWETKRQKPLDWVVRNPRAAAAVERYCLPKAQGVLVVVEEARAHAVACGVAEDRVTVVSNTPPLSRVREPRRPSPERSGERLQIAYMGLMEIARGVGVLLDAAAALKGSIPGIRVHLIGGGRDLPQLKEKATSLGLESDDVIFYGFIPSYSTALEIVTAADVGVIPHFANDWANTTIPNKLFDYMAAGLPVISSDSVPCARILRETGAGLLFHDRNSGSLAEALIQLRDSGERYRLARLGHEAVVGRYHWERDQMKLFDVVERVMDRESSQRVRRSKEVEV